MKPLNREIEIKLPVRDLTVILERLRGLGARRMRRLHERNTLFDTQDGYFQRRCSILRIRIEEEVDGRSRYHPAQQRRQALKGLLTFKSPPRHQRNGRRSPQSRYKERDEIEYRLPDALRFARLLGRLGLRAWFQYEKYRTQYRISGSALHIDLDETPIGIFLELEGAPRSIDKAARALGYFERDYITASYLELYAAECARKGERVANMVFSKKKNAKSRTLRLTKFPSAFNK